MPNKNFLEFRENNAMTCSVVDTGSQTSHLSYLQLPHGHRWFFLSHSSKFPCFGICSGSLVLKASIFSSLNQQKSPQPNTAKTQTDQPSSEPNKSPWVGLTALRLQFHSNLSQTNFWWHRLLPLSGCMFLLFPLCQLQHSHKPVQNHFSELNQKTPTHWRELEKYPSAWTMHQNRLVQVLASTRAPSEAATQYISPGYHQTNSSDFTHQQAGQAAELTYKRRESRSAHPQRRSHF